MDNPSFGDKKDSFQEEGVGIVGMLQPGRATAQPLIQTLPSHGLTGPDLKVVLYIQ